jgi:hypothetical protein
MALEEILTIYDPIDTPKIARAFKEAGMPARVTQTVTVNYPALAGVASCFIDNTCITPM